MYEYECVYACEYVGGVCMFIPYPTSDPDPRMGRMHESRLACHGVRPASSCGCIPGVWWAGARAAAGAGQAYGVENTASDPMTVMLDGNEKQVHEEQPRDDTETWSGTSGAGIAGLLQRWQLADSDTVGSTAQ